MDPFLGEIRIFAGLFAPRGWALCNGQLLSIPQNTALFSLLGVSYGGDGRSTFALPDLRGRAPVHQGQGAGLSRYVLGQSGGTSTVTLDATTLPAHTHALRGLSDPAESAAPGGKALARGVSLTPYATAADTRLANTALQGQGGNQAHNNLPPYLSLNFIIATQGMYPPRS